MRPNLFAAVVLSLTATVALAGPEYPVGKSVYGPAPGTHGPTSVSTDGSDYLVAWVDGRTTTTQRVMASRVTRAGDVLDPLGILVTEDSSITGPNVVWTGNTYLLVWVAGQPGAQLMAATISRDGTLSPPRAIANVTALMGSGGTGDGAMVFYRRGADMRAVLFDAAGNATGDVQIDQPDPQRSFVTMASNGREVMIAWTVFRDNAYRVEALRIGRDGSVIGRARDLGIGFEPLLATDGTDFVIAYRRPHLGVYTWASRALPADLSAAGSPSVFPLGQELTSGSLLWNGSEYIFIGYYYGARFRLSGVRIGRDGKVLDDEIEVEQLEAAGGAFPSPRAATNRGTILAAWVESSRTADVGGYEVRVVARLYSATTLDQRGNEVLLSISANRQMNPAAAFDPSSTALVAWRESRGIFASRVSPDGRTLDGRGIELSASRSASSPKVVFDGDQFVVAWNELGVLQVRFITPFGNVRAEAVSIQGVQSFALKNGFKGAMLAWTDNDHRLWATRIDRETRMADPAPVAVSPEGVLATAPSLAWNGRDTLVAWVEMTTGFMHGPWFIYHRIRGTRLSATFTVIDTAPLNLGEVAGVDNFQPSVASNGNEWLVTWVADGTQLRANRVLRNGNLAGLVEGTLLSADDRLAVTAEVIFDRTRYAVAFKRGRELFTAFIPAGGPLELTGLAALGDTRSDQNEISITRTATSLVVAYTRVSDAPEHAGVERAFIKYVESTRKVRAVR